MAALKDMACLAVTAIKLLGVDAVELAHTLLQIALRGLNDEVVMIAHQTIGMTAPIEARADFAEYLQPRVPILRSVIDVLTTVAARGDVVKATG